MNDPTGLTLCAAADAISRGEITSEELTAACLDRVDRLDEGIGAFLRLDRDRAMAAARTADRDMRAGRHRGPLHGIPLAHKDMFYRAGDVCTCGSVIRGDFRPTTTATVLKRLDSAGAITLGALHMAEFALGPTGHNHHFGRCRNPRNPDYISGGSSSGSAAAVAARMVFGALGSDTGGSVRLPAAACGVVGLKPTQDLVPVDGTMGLSSSLDCIGPLARSARDAGRLLDVLCGTTGYEPQPGEQLRLDGLVIGRPTSYYNERLDDEVGSALNDAASVLAGLGARTVEVDLPDHTAFADLANILFTPEAAALHHDWLRDRPEDYGPQVRARLLQGFTVPALHYLQARQVRALHLAAMIEGPLAQCDAILTPVLRRAVPTAAEVDVAAGGQMDRVLGDLTAFTRPLSYLGLPGLVMPISHDQRSLPIAMQLIGRPHAERMLLRIAAAYEEAEVGHSSGL